MEKKIINALRKVIDPELGVNIVDLGLVYKVDIKGNTVKVLMTLTSPACPLADTFEDLIIDAVKKVKGIKKVQVNLTFTPPWNPRKLERKVKLKLGF